MIFESPLFLPEQVYARLKGPTPDFRSPVGEAWGGRGKVRRYPGGVIWFRPDEKRSTECPLKKGYGQPGTQNSKLSTLPNFDRIRQSQVVMHEHAITQ